MLQYQIKDETTKLKAHIGDFAIYNEIPYLIVDARLLEEMSCDYAKDMMWNGYDVDSFEMEIGNFFGLTFGINLNSLEIEPLEGNPDKILKQKAPLELVIK